MDDFDKHLGKMEEELPKSGKSKNSEEISGAIRYFLKLPSSPVQLNDEKTKKASRILSVAASQSTLASLVFFEQLGLYKKKELIHFEQLKEAWLRQCAFLWVLETNLESKPFKDSTYSFFAKAFQEAKGVFGGLLEEYEKTILEAFVLDFVSCLCFIKEGRELAETHKKIKEAMEKFKIVKEKSKEWLEDMPTDLEKAAMWTLLKAAEQMGAACLKMVEKGPQNSKSVFPNGLVRSNKVTEELEKKKRENRREVIEIEEVRGQSEGKPVVFQFKMMEENKSPLLKQTKWDKTLDAFEVSQRNENSSLKDFETKSNNFANSEIKRKRLDMNGFQPLDNHLALLGRSRFFYLEKVQAPEDHLIEFKMWTGKWGEKLEHKFRVTACSFLNSGGGCIFFGISENKDTGTVEIRGMEFNEKAKDLYRMELRRRIIECFSPDMMDGSSDRVMKIDFIPVVTEAQPEQTLSSLHVARVILQPVHLQDVYMFNYAAKLSKNKKMNVSCTFIRNGSMCMALKSDQVKKLIRERLSNGPIIPKNLEEVAARPKVFRSDSKTTNVPSRRNSNEKELRGCLEPNTERRLGKGQEAKWPSLNLVQTTQKDKKVHQIFSISNGDFKESDCVFWQEEISKIAQGFPGIFEAVVLLEPDKRMRAEITGLEKLIDDFLGHLMGFELVNSCWKVPN